MRASTLPVLTALLLVAACGGDPTAPAPDAVSELDASRRHASAPTVTPQTSGTINRLQAISVVSPRVVWVSGLGGTYAVTTDGGATWRAAVVPGAEALQFRDVEAFSARVAYLMAAGSGSDSRIYKTEDGGASWTLQFENQDPAAFYDCFAFWNRRHGVTFSDAVSGRFPVIRTTDGETWQDIGDNLPAAQDGEAAFAASGTCITTQGGKRAWITTGGAARARVFATTDGGDSWESYDTPIVQGTPISGGFSIAFRDPNRGILVGGDLGNAGITDNVAVSRDGGRTWSLATPTPFGGAAFAVTYVEGDGRDGGHHGHHGGGRRTVVSTGPGGTAWSPDEGETWTQVPDVTGYWAVAFANSRSGWLVGTEGRILKISF